LAYWTPLAVILCVAGLALIWIQLERAIRRLDDIAWSLRQMPAVKQADARGERPWNGCVPASFGSASRF
jgi:hypothetical protein